MIARTLAVPTALLLAAAAARAGDPYHGFDAFAGRWRVESCRTEGVPFGKLPDISISLTLSRSNAVNVYFLDGRGKKSSLHFSTTTSVPAGPHRSIYAGARSETVKAKAGLTSTDPVRTGILSVVLEGRIEGLPGDPSGTREEESTLTLRVADGRLRYERKGTFAEHRSAGEVAQGALSVECDLVK
jgi:hypothetical protein